MKTTKQITGEKVVVKAENFQQLFNAITDSGYKVVGPSIEDGAIIYKDLSSVNDLPAGWTDVQDKGKYRLKKRGDKAFFGYNLTFHSLKRFLYPPEVTLYNARNNGKGLQISQNNVKSPKYAFLGVRACEIKALEVFDKIFQKGQYADSLYKKLRRDSIVVAVNCNQAGGTCFCTASGSGPQVKEGFDLCLTEVCNPQEHYFIVETGSKRGENIAAKVPSEPASDIQKTVPETVASNTAGQIKRHVDIQKASEIFDKHFEHPVWDEIASQCLTCGNCTMVCPTCFCTTVVDKTDLTGKTASRERRWDSCFSLDFSYIFGGSVRSSAESRYRQWAMHKFANLAKQFDSPGCVGCGRCITWCPAGIDITEVINTLCENETIATLQK